MLVNSTIFLEGGETRIIPFCLIPSGHTILVLFQLSEELMIPKIFQIGITQTPNGEFKIILQEVSFSFLLSMDVEIHGYGLRIFLLCSGASELFQEEDFRV